MESVERRVTLEMNNMLTKPYQAEEVFTVLQQMHPSKARGPDGMSVLFFQKYWHIVGSHVTVAVLSCLNSGHILKSSNFTHIVLIPKVKNPTRVSDYRPISLCNVIFKLISKVMVNRLKRILPKIISDNQSAFVPGRLITDNFLVAFEILHSMHKRRGGEAFFTANHGEAGFSWLLD